MMENILDGARVLVVVGARNEREKEIRLRADMFRLIENEGELVFTYDK